LEQQGMGGIAFSPLEQGLLTDRYLNGFPEESRAVKDARYLKTDQITPEKLDKVRKLNDIALGRGQSLAQMAIAWLLKDSRITSVLVGASRPSQLQDSIDSLKNISFSSEELANIEAILA
jgi:L-glyceraldehyde 3-phosphate reductase